MLLTERMVLTKLNRYREQANRDRFILPQNQKIDLFTDIIDECVNFFNIDLNKNNFITEEEKNTIIKENNIKLEVNEIKKSRGRPKTKILDT